jgi:hypothetical protein
MHLRRPSPTAAIALLALFFALGGTAIAAKHYLITSASQIKPSVLKQLQGKTGPPGPAGANGSNGANGTQGPQGANGPPGPTTLSAITVHQGPSEGYAFDLELGEYIAASFAECGAGEKVVSGTEDFYLAPTALVGYRSEGGTAFIVAGSKETTTGLVTATAFCAKAGGAVTPGARVAPGGAARNALVMSQVVAHIRKQLSR